MGRNSFPQSCGTGPPHQSTSTHASQPFNSFLIIRIGILQSEVVRLPTHTAVTRASSSKRQFFEAPVLRSARSFERQACAHAAMPGRADRGVGGRFSRPEGQFRLFDQSVTQITDFSCVCGYDQP